MTLMKLIQRLSVFVIFATISLSIFAQENGIEFFEGTWAEAVQTAKVQKKGVFLDGYASWCAPCKKMIKEVFPQAKVGETFNEKFINVKMDMEKGEGPVVAEKFGIKAYPTFLFFEPNGSLVHKSGGFIEANSFIELAEAATDPNKQYFTLSNKYKAGDRNPMLIKNLVEAATHAFDSNLAIEASNEYLASLGKRELNSANTRDIVMQIPADADSKAFELLMADWDGYSKVYGSDKVEQKLITALNYKIRSSAKEGDKEVLNWANALVAKHMPSKAEKLNAEMSMNYYQKAKSWDNYSDHAIIFAEQFANDDWNALNGIAWTFYEKVDDKEALAKAASFAARSVEIDANYYNTDTHAAVLGKLGNYDDAFAPAKNAIEFALADNIEPKETMELMFGIASKAKSHDALNFVLANNDEFSSVFGQEKMEAKYGKIMGKRVSYAAKKGNENELKAMQEIAKKQWPKEATNINTELELEYFYGSAQWDQYIASADNYIEKMGGNKDWNVLNTVSWIIYENVDNKKNLKKALTWTKQSMDLDKNYYNTDTYAALLYKTGDSKGALKACKEALSLAKKEGVDGKETQLLMEKLESLKP